MDSKDNNKVAEKTKRRKKIRRNIVLICIIVIMGMIIFRVLSEEKNEFTEGLSDSVANVIEGEDGKVSTISRASLEKVFEISELSTADYTYNAIAKAYGEDGITIRYYVAYEGKIEAGIDFSKIDIEIKEEEKIIAISIPDIEFTDCKVDPGTLEFIFKDKKSETETVHQEAFQICEQDLDERIKIEEKLMTLAKENAVAVVEALVKPWVEQTNPEYKVEIQ